VLATFCLTLAFLLWNNPTKAVEVDVHRQSEAGYMPAEQELLVGDIAPQADKI
jgi:hypothetical protein